MSGNKKSPRSLAKNLLLLALSCVCLGIAVIVVLSRISPPRFEVPAYQGLMRRLAADGQPPDRGATEQFMRLTELASMAAQVSNEGPRRLLDPSRPPPTKPIDYRSAWGEWGADSAERTEATEAFMLLYANGFAEKIESLAAAPSIVRDLAHTVFLARGADEDARAVQALSQALIARMLIASEEKRPERLIAAFDQSLALAFGCAHQPRPSNWEVGAGALLSSLAHVRMLVAHDALDEAASRGLLEAMDRRLPFPSIAKLIRARHYGAVNALWETLSPQGSKRGPQSYLAYLVARASVGGFEENRAAIDAYFDNLIAEAARPCAEHRQAGVTLGSLDFPEGAGWGHFVEPRGLPKFILAQDRVRVAIEGTRIVLAAHVHRLRNGSYPPSLAALVPTLLRSVPRDPFDPSREMSYQSTGQWPTGRVGPAFIVYSVGEDGVDDGGKEVAGAALLDASLGGGDLVVSVKNRAELVR